MASDPALVEALHSTDLFGSLGRRALNRLADAFKVVHHEAGKSITTQGQDGIAFHLILDGTATVSVAGHTGHPLGKGEYFGEISMIDGQPRSASVVADTALTTAGITSWSFHPLLDEEPEITKALLLVLCKRIRQSEKSESSD